MTATDTQTLDQLAKAALHCFSLPAGLSLSMVNLSENATYRLTAPDGRRWALRLHRPGYHTRADIASELAWLTALRRDGVVVTPLPVAGLDGEWIQHVAGDEPAASRHAVLFEWEEGLEPEIRQDLSPSFRQLGSIAARMHRHARHWQRPAAFTRFTWDFETSLGEAAPHWGRWRDGIGMTPQREALFERTVGLIGQRLLRYGKGPDRFGLVHGDLRLANLLVDGETLKVIDFDDMGFSWFMYDAATPVSFHEHEPQVESLVDAWKDGYRQVLPLAREDEAEIPTFLMLRRLLLVAWIGSHAATDLAQSLGSGYTEGSDRLCEDYLSRFG